MNGHRSDYYSKLSDKPVAEHFNMIGHSFEDLTVIIIEQTIADFVRRKRRESFRIRTLWTLAPDGLNLDPYGIPVDIKPGSTRRFADNNGCAFTTSVEKKGNETIPSLRLIKNCSDPI